MKLFSKVILLSPIAYAYARQVKFNVICMNCSNVSVNAGGISQPMAQVNGLPYYSATLDVADPVSYSYVAGGQAESFTRSLDSSLSQTYNDFYGRQETVKEIYQFGYPNAQPWTRSIGRTELFDESYIPTIYITGSGNFFQTAPKTAVNFETLTVFMKNTVQTFANVPASCKNRNEDKFQIRFGLTEGINKRTIFKLRPSSEDPTFMRQIIYSDMMHAVGNPAHESVACRVYADGNPIGLYVLQEDTTTLSFIKSAFYGNESTGKINTPNGLGSPLDCSTGADFQPDGEYSSFKALANKSNVLIDKLTNALSALDINNKEAIKEFNDKWMDLNIFFRALALEYLTGHWDSYWYYTTNFVMYDDPSESTSSTVKYYFVDQDFDLTWGCGLSDQINRFGNEFPKKSYKEDVNRSWSISDLDGPTRYAVDKLLSGGLTQGMFEVHLISIVKHIFNPVALGAKVEAYKERIRPEIEWDYGLVRQYNSPNPEKYIFNIEDFDTNINTGGRRHTWGIMDWTTDRANAVASEFGFTWDQVALTPETATKVEVKEVEPIESGSSEVTEFTGQTVTGVGSNGDIISSASSVQFLSKSLFMIVLFYLLL